MERFSWKFAHEQEAIRRAALKARRNTQPMAKAAAKESLADRYNRLFYVQYGVTEAEAESNPDGFNADGSYTAR